MTLTRLRELDLAGKTGARRHAHLSAASGLVSIGSFLYVVADDEHHLGVFRATGSSPGETLRLFEGDLPHGKKRRKALKPDLEVLILLPAFDGYACGALLALGSGSRPNRRKGALLGLNAQGAPHGDPVLVDLAALFLGLEGHFPDLNIEGGFVNGHELCLLQRGNKGGDNAVVRFRLADLMHALKPDVLKTTARAQRMNPVAITRVEIGEIDAIPLCFTDGAALPNGDFVFTAVAEDTDNSYADGTCAGAAIGVAGKDGVVRSLYRFSPAPKIEGVDARLEGETVRLLLVTDADDAKIPATLYSAEMELVAPAD